MSRIVIIAERKDTDGNTFRTVHELPHQPVPINRNVAGWSGEGAGLSDEDWAAIGKLMGEWACNVQRVEITLCQGENHEPA